MGQFIKGGYGSVLVPDDAEVDPTINVVHELNKILKAGTSLEPSSPEEEFADALTSSAGKGMTVGVRSADMDATMHAKILAADEKQIKIPITFESLVGRTDVDECEAGWASAAGSVAYDAADKKSGAASVRWQVPNPGADVLLYKNLAASIDLTKATAILLWVKMAAGTPTDLHLLLDDTAACASPIEDNALPDHPVGGWKRLIVWLDDPSLLGAVQSIGIKITNLSYDLDLRLDGIRAFGKHVTVKQIVPAVNIEKNEAGKFNAIRITGKAFADTEANLIDNQL